MKVTPLFKRYLVFHMPIRQKFKNSSLYVANASRGSMNRAEEIWIIEAGKECTLELKLGDHCWLYDAFELTEVDLDLWKHFSELDAFKKLKEMADKCGGIIKTKLVLEDSILAVDPEYQIEPETRGLLWAR